MVVRTSYYQYNTGTDSVRQSGQSKNTTLEGMDRNWRDILNIIWPNPCDLWQSLSSGVRCDE
jgi:hypothetical protein